MKKTVSKILLAVMALVMIVSMLPMSAMAATSEYHFNSLTDVTPGADKEAIAAGTTYADGFFTTVGTVTQRYSDSKGGVYAIEIGKNLSGSLDFTVAGSAEVTLVVSSTGGSNTSVVAIVNAEGNVMGEIHEVSTTSTTTLTFSLEAGTYSIVSPENKDLNRGFRLMTVDVVVTEEEAPVDPPVDPVDPPVDPVDPPVDPVDPPVEPENPGTGDNMAFFVAVVLLSVSMGGILLVKKYQF